LQNILVGLDDRDLAAQERVELRDRNNVHDRHGGLAGAGPGQPRRMGAEV
jgi:hypothetical protein